MGTIIIEDGMEIQTVKISELPSLDDATISDNLPVVASGSTLKITKAKFNKGLLPDRCAYVSPSFTDNEDMQRFSTIQAAIDFAYGEWGPVTDSSNKVVISIGPGIYEEQIHSYENIVLVSYVSGYNSIHSSPPATIYNTGADLAHYPLRSDEDEVYNLSGINIKTDAGGVLGKIPNAEFHNCSTENGHFIERNSNCLALFNTCTFRDSDYGGFYLVGTNLTGYRNIILRDNCVITFNVIPTLLSTHTSWTNFKCDKMELEGAFNVAGDWEFRFRKSVVYRMVQRNIIGTSAEVYIADSVVLNGIHFTTDPSVFKMVNSSFEGISDNKIPDGEADITADVPITDIVYSSNTQHNGLSGKIQIQCPIKTVGCAALNRYFSIQDAIDSIADTGVVDLWESLTDLAELIIPAGISVTIDGHKIYSLTFTGDIVELQANESIIFYGLAQLNGGNVEVNGNSAYVGFEECLTVNAYVTLTSGTSSYCLVYTSTIKAPTGHPAITQDIATSVIIAGYSRIDGGIGHPAILTTVEADSGIKAKFSTLIHGDGGGNSPLIYTGANKMDVLFYSCALNAMPASADYTNLISSANNTVSPEIDF